MIAQAPVSLHCWETCCARLILLRDFCYGGPVIEEEVDAATEQAPRKALRAQKHFLAMQVSQIDPMRIRLIVRTATSPSTIRLCFIGPGIETSITASLKVPGLQIEGMTAIEISVNWVSYVSSVDGGIEIVVEPQTVNTFAKSIEIVVFGQVCLELNELIFVDKCRVFRGEDDVPS